jgi:hypothetical protein
MKRVESRLNDVKVRFKAGCQSSAVNVVEFLGELPRIFCIVNYKLAVGWDAATSAMDLEAS